MNRRSRANRFAGKLAASDRTPVLILGAGINGAAVAREFLMQRVPVCLVDCRDLAGGTTAYSSRLIHGGLRYLEYADFPLVRESLSERDRLFRLAPQFVRPLRFHIPIGRRWGGWSQAVRRCLRLGDAAGSARPRGLWLVRSGLRVYDQLATSRGVPRSTTTRVDAMPLPQVDPQKYRWLCSYSDAQILYPERFVIALLRDAARLSQQHGVRFDVYPYHRATRSGRTVVIERDGVQVEQLEPAGIVNATGAWVDATLRELAVPSRRLMGGTQGSHIFSWQPQLRRVLGNDAVYAEAADGRPVFVLPWRDATLIGTTDRAYHGDPRAAVAAPAEIDYLLAAVNQILPAANLRREDVGFHYSGVRPLPWFRSDRPTAAVPRRHLLVRHADIQPAVYSLVGGKLTTCRSLAEQTVRTIMQDWDQQPQADSRDRLLPGADGFPADPLEEQRVISRLAADLALSRRSADAAWWLTGAEARRLLDGNAQDQALVEDTALPVCFVRRVIREEWVTRLSDLVERRLMLLYDQQTSLATLTHLAGLLVEEGKLAADHCDEAVKQCRARLELHFGRILQSDTTKRESSQ